MRDLDLAEECVQEAYAAALVAWARDGIPDNPSAWLTTTARRRAMDTARRERVLRSKLPLLLAEVEELERQDQLASDQYLPAIKADLLRRLGRTEEASVAYQQDRLMTR